MDFLNKTFAQFSDLFRTMTPGARITAGLLLAVVVISLTYLFSYQMSSSDTFLLGGKTFKPEESARIQAALGDKGFKCTVDGYRIKIPSGLRTEYMAALAEAGALPRGWNDQGDGLTGGSTFEDPDSRKQRIKLSTEKDLAFVIAQFEEVENARVMFGKSTTRGLRKKVVTTASVSAYPVSSRGLSDETVKGIKDYVSGALTPMKPEDVNVINGRTGRSYVSDDGAKNGLHGNRYHKLTQEWEEYYTNKIHKLLTDIPGVRARMTVILDPTESMAETTFTPDKKETAPWTTTTKEKTSEHEGAVPSGRPGYKSNQAMALSGTTGRGSKNNETEEESITTNLVAQKNGSKVTTGMTPTWMAASVVVPHSYLVDVWKQKNPPAEGEDPKVPKEEDLQSTEQKVVARIQELVVGLLPDNMENVTDKTKLVTVTVGRDIVPDPMPEPAMTSTAMAWLGANWGMIGVVVLALASLSMLRSMIKSTPLESPAGQQPAMALTAEMGAPGDEGGEEGVDRQQRRLARFAAGGSSLRDELSEMVQEDPDAAANILRTWIGTSSIKV